MNSKEAAEFLRVSVRTLHEYVKREKIPYLRLGKRLLRFDSEELMAWMKGGKNAKE